jgi:hypothetical protein
MSSQNEQDQIELLTHELRRRGDAFTDSPLGFDAVRGQAVSIRRRRRVATGLAVAAAVAVIVPTAIVAAKNVNADGIQPATQTPSVSTPSTTTTTSATPGNQPKPHALDVADLPTGAPPNLVYATKPDYRAFTMAGDHTVRVFDTGVVVSSETSDQTFGPYPTSSPLARNADGTVVAWLTDNGDLMAWQDGRSQPLTIATTTLQGAQLEALTGGDCTTGDCVAWIRGNTASGQPASERIDGTGAVSPVDPQGRIIQVRDADDQGRVLGSTEITDTGSCSSVIAGATTLLHTCDYTFDAFSPDGSLVLASEPYHDGAGASVIATFTTAGDRLAYRVRTGQTMAMYQQAVWEDDTHVLFTAYQDGQWSIVRMDAVTGALETAVPPRPGSYDDCPFTLETT